MTPFHGVWVLKQSNTMNLEVEFGLAVLSDSTIHVEIRKYRV